MGAILLSIDPLEVDVNVHPAKTEVRLSREREIHDGILRLVKSALRQDGIIPLFQPRHQPRSTQFEGDNFRERNPNSVSPSIPGLFNREPLSRESLADLYCATSGFQPLALKEDVQVNTETGEIVQAALQTDLTRSPNLATVSLSSGIRLAGRFSDLYLILQAGDDLYIVDQHTAHERVLYEETYRRLESHALVGQHLLLPVQVELNLDQMAIFQEAGSILNQSGFVVSEFGGRMINIEAIPSILARKSPERVIRNLLDDIVSLRKEGHDLRKGLAQSMACRAAVMAGDRLSDQEAVGLLEQLLHCENRYSCPHGRPTFVKITRAELDKQFGRG